MFILKGNVIQTNKYAGIWSQNVHFVTTLPVHLIQKLILQKLLSYVYFERKCYTNH